MGSRLKRTAAIAMTTLTGVDINGASAIVTGGASGIGLATAHRFAAEGARVVIADLDAATGQRAADEVGGVFRTVVVAD